MSEHWTDWTATPCGECGRAVVWAVNLETDRQEPFDLNPHYSYGWKLFCRDLRGSGHAPMLCARRVGDGETISGLSERYQRHKCKRKK